MEESSHISILLRNRGLYQDGNTSYRASTEVKHLELNQFSDGSTEAFYE